MKPRVTWAAMPLLSIAALAMSGVAAAGATGADTLVGTVRQSTAVFGDVTEAHAAGYGLFHGCVAGPQQGAMGVHLVNGDLVGDGQLDPARPEALLYEQKNGQMRLVAVEFVVIAEAWHAANEHPPVLMGQLFNYVGAPNRYGIPAFYELHVWAWKHNPSGLFADWNPMVSCAEFSGGTGMPAGHH